MKKYRVTLIHTDEKQNFTYETEAGSRWDAFLKQPVNPNLKGPASYVIWRVEECVTIANETRNTE